MSTFKALHDAFVPMEAFSGVLSEQQVNSVAEQYSAVFTDAAYAPALSLLGEAGFENYAFHNKAHTASVIWGGLFLGAQSGIDAQQMRLLMFSACFHDVGYLEGGPDHEKRSAAFLREHASAELSASDRETVESLIMSTKLQADSSGRMLQVRSDGLSALLLDADLLNVGFCFDEYLKVCRGLFEERTGTQVSAVGDDELLAFQKTNLEFLLAHSFQTEVARELFEASKREKIERFQEALASNINYLG